MSKLLIYVVFCISLSILLPIVPGYAVDVYKEFETDIIPPSWKDKTWDKNEFKKWYESTIKNKKQSIEYFIVCS